MFFKIVSLVLCALFFSASDDLQQLRDCYQQVGMEERYVAKILNLCEQSRQVDENLLSAYEASAKICSAKYKFSPYAKYTAFSAGRIQLDQAVQADSLNVEIRYLRYTIQKNAPTFLGYYKNIDQDRSFIIRTLPQVKKKDAQLYAIIQSFLLRSK